MLEFNVRAYKQVRVFFSLELLCLLRRTDEATTKAKQLSTATTPLCFGSFGVVLMSCRVNFHVVRAALQNLVFLLSVIIFADQVFFRFYAPGYSFAVLCGLNECTRECKNSLKIAQKTAFETKGRLSDTTGKVIQRLFFIDSYTYLAIYRHG